MSKEKVAVQPLYVELNNITELQDSSCQKFNPDRHVILRDASGPLQVTVDERGFSTNHTLFSIYGDFQKWADAVVTNGAYIGYKNIQIFTFVTPDGKKVKYVGADKKVA